MSAVAGAPSIEEGLTPGSVPAPDERVGGKPVAIPVVAEPATV